MDEIMERIECVKKTCSEIKESLLNIYDVLSECNVSTTTLKEITKYISLLENIYNESEINVSSAERRLYDTAKILIKKYNLFKLKSRDDILNSQLNKTKIDLDNLSVMKFDSSLFVILNAICTYLSYRNINIDSSYGKGTLFFAIASLAWLVKYSYDYEVNKNKEEDYNKLTKILKG